MVTTNDDELAEKLRILRVHGSKPKYYHRMIGGNFRLDPIQAAVLEVKFESLPEWTASRQQHAEQYDQLFAESKICHGNVTPPAASFRESGLPGYHVYNQYMLRVTNRDGLMDHLTEAGIGTALYYPVPFHMQECFQYLGIPEGTHPESEKAALETIAIPVAPELTESDVAYVVQTIEEFYRS
jgi:dTDP-4-amino-4,6-dideoxygalactose transaminase